MHTAERATTTTSAAMPRPASLSSSLDAWHEPGVPGLLALEGGIIQAGRLRGAHVPASGDLIFTTAATGWGEILTDPSYAGQIVVLTHPMAGNYRIAEEELESARVHARALAASGRRRDRAAASRSCWSRRASRPSRGSTRGR